MKKFKLLLASALMVSFLTGCSSEKMKLKTDTLTIEYGKTVSSDVKDYLDNTDEFLKEVKIEGIPENESETEYPSVGEYDLSLKYEDNVEKVKIIVKDSVAPAFKDVKDKYEVKYGDKFNINSIKAEDLSKVDLSIVGDVDYKKAGTYKVNVVAKDESGNEAKKEISIVVKEEEKKENSSSSTSSSSKKSNTSGASSSSSSSKSSSSSSNSNKSNSSSSSTSKKPGGSGSSSSDKKTNGSSSSSHSNSNEITINEYKCLEPDCGKHFKTYNELKKHQNATSHGGYAGGSETVDEPMDWY